MTDDAMRALAKRFFDCVEAGDIDGLVACYAPDAKIWHNTDEQIQGPEDNKKTLAGMVTRILDRVYDNRRVEVFPGGFLQQDLDRWIRAEPVGENAARAAGAHDDIIPHARLPSRGDSPDALDDFDIRNCRSQIASIHQIAHV